MSKQGSIVITVSDRVSHDQFVEVITQVTHHLQHQALRYFPDGAMVVQGFYPPVSDAAGASGAADTAAVKRSDDE
jgi:hypothetical protein